MPCNNTSIVLFERSAFPIILPGCSTAYNHWGIWFRRLIFFLVWLCLFHFPGNISVFGAVTAVCSAVAWAMASFSSSNPWWCNWFNLFAALLAGFSVGCVTPPETVCHRFKRSDQKVVWKANTFVFDIVDLCGNRVAPPLPPKP